jgi:hypothetical protein
MAELHIANQDRCHGTIHSLQTATRYRENDGNDAAREPTVPCPM